MLLVVAPTGTAAVVEAIAEVTGIPCGGKGGGTSSLSFRAEATVDVAIDAEVAIVVPDTTVGGFVTGFVAKLFRGSLSLLQ